MGNNKIITETLKLLWELFKDECPFFVNQVTNVYESFINRMNGRSENNQLFTILFEILPAEIHIIKPKKYEYEKVIRQYTEGICVEYRLNNMQKPVLYGEYSADIWHALHSLLLEIKKMKDKEGDNLKFVWGMK